MLLFHLLDYLDISHTVGVTEEDLENIQDAIVVFISSWRIYLRKWNTLRGICEWYQNFREYLTKEWLKPCKKLGFRLVRQWKHVTMTNRERILTIPRSNPLNASNMAGILKNAGLTIEEFKK